jgi:NDP-sugar pyrophosphorylase family protein
VQVVILAGGLGTRMRPVASDIPKCLIPVAGRPFADHQLSWLAGQGVSEVLYSIGYLGERIRAFAGDGARWNLKIRYVDEGTRLRGTAGALRLAFDADMLEERFEVLYGDSYLHVDLNEVGAAHRASGLPALMTVFRNTGRWEESNAAFDGTLVTRYEKHCPEPSADMCFVDYGLSSLTRSVVERYVTPDAKSDLASLYSMLSRERRLGGFEVSTRFYEIGSPEGLRELEDHLDRSPQPESGTTTMSQLQEDCP